MSRWGDIPYFLCQIFFPNWTERKDDTEPTALQKILAAVFLFLTSRNGTGTTFSVILHVFILVILALIPFLQHGSLTGIDILGDFYIPGIEHTAVIAPPSDDNGTQQNVVQANQTTESVTPTPIEQQTAVEATTDSTPADNMFSEERLKIQAVGGFVSGGGFQSRTPAGRQRALQGGGSSQRGEEAVEAALAWLAAHQNKTDGGWSLHLGDNAFCTCSHSGTSPTNRRTAATALALLAFLGAGYSHQEESQYRAVVEKGLTFLTSNPNGGIDGAAIQNDAMKMYSHGLAAIALCEAYAVSKRQDPDSMLGRKAQKSLFDIETAQDRDYGGWRYRPNQSPGDTSVFAWQLMALKSGKIGGLHVSPSVLYAAQDFLNSVALDGGRHYQYRPDGKWDAIRGEDSPQTCTAIGLLMRMYLGWKPGDPFLDDGIKQIAHWGYALKEGECNLYYAYYATLALHHYGGEHWDSWNSGLQETLIRTQARQGCEAGSWYFRDPYCDVGGRLLNTALGAMILETPYRIMPLYRKIR